MRLYHFTLRSLSARILREGLQDSETEGVQGTEWHGVWLADVALAEDEGLDPDDFVTLAVDAPDEELEPYEVVGNPMLRPGSHREWCIPSAVVNRWPRTMLT